MKQNRIAANKQGSSPSRANPALDGLIARAVQLHQASRLPEAEALYRDVLTIDPRHADALHLLGVIAQQCGQHAAAVDLIEKAISENPREPIFHNSLGLALRSLNRLDDALRHFKRAVALKPDYSTAAVNLGLALLFVGRIDEATRVAATALAAAETAEAKMLFIQCLGLRQDPVQLAASRAMLLRAMAERWSRPEDLARNACRVVAESGALAKAVKRTSTAWPRRLPGGELDLAIAQSDALLQIVLTSAPVNTVELERYLTNVRSALLALSAMSPNGGLEFLSLACALARQCYINEYVFDCGAAEMAQLDRLRQSLAAALAAGQPAAPLQLAVCAAYAPLETLAPAETLLAIDGPAPLKALLIQQVQEPATERRLRGTISQLTPIENTVSIAVREQYEHHPYPRWVETVSMELSPARLPLGNDILVAGCGTGRQLIEYARRNADARVLAIDLSLASLSYAMRKSREIGLQNIEFAQADILELGSLARTFDFIDSSGVLHHLADPWRGWRNLAGLLKPGATMRVALYSELGRLPLIAARDFIVQRGYSGSTEDIRRFRQDILQQPELTAATQSRDFYTISSCRDLLFHVQEQRMTIPEIKTFLAENGLEFVSFDMPASPLQRFRDRFPERGSEADLDRWHIFEQENPSAFTGMYQFDVKKR